MVPRGCDAALHECCARENVRETAGLATATRGDRLTPRMAESVEAAPADPPVDPRPRLVVGEPPASIASLRGVPGWDEARSWLAARGIEDIECLTPDLAGVPRGKMMPASKFLTRTSLSLPSAIFTHTISGEYADETDDFHYRPDDGDWKLVPDLSTLTRVPWESDPTAQVVCDIHDSEGQPVAVTPRNVLKRVLSAYAARGWRPIVAPEIEFYLVSQNDDPDFPLKPPKGRSGRPISSGQAYSIAGVNEYDELIDDIYHYAEAQGLEIDTLIHEEGISQLEINLRHGDPLELADQVFLFKRTIREAALKHGVYATFMAKPMQGQPGSAMHIHQSILDAGGHNVFSAPDGGETDAFRHFIGGMQRFVPSALVMMAPYVNSYRRLARDMGCPVNTEWGHDNRTTAFRVPPSGPEGRRVENRLPSSDANPYLAIAASLACGLLGIEQRVEPSEPTSATVNEGAITLPRSLLDALGLLEREGHLRGAMGPEFAAAYVAVKRSEFETFMQVISPWEREFLLLNV